MKKMNILIGCLLYRNYTGSEMYVYELAKGLKKKGHNVSIISAHLDGPLSEETKTLGIQIYSLNSPPTKQNFDLIHSQHQPIVQKLLELYPKTKMVCTIHSEVIPIENPIIHPNIEKYIAIRPEIKNYITQNFFPLTDKEIDIIYNPIDENRFNQKNIKNDGYVLFVGTIDYLRKNTIFDLIRHTKSTQQEFVIVGKNHSDYFNQLFLEPHVKYFGETKAVENFVKNCSETSSVLMGRTTIEGWMCGKPGWIYNIDSDGNIINKQLHQPPNDIEKFNSFNVINNLEKVYYEVIK
jgi:glycosyltransferase involved in cell wall biosynthesis